MKALLASTATALVLVSAAWASNVTPAQLSALSKRVTKLERDNAFLKRSLTNTQADVVHESTLVGCLQTGFNGLSTTSYLVSTWGGFDTKSGNLSLFIAPAPNDGLTGSGYLVTSADPAGDAC